MRFSSASPSIRVDIPSKNGQKIHEQTNPAEIVNKTITHYKKGDRKAHTNEDYLPNTKKCVQRETLPSTNQQH